jgi:hypothetical protein
MPSPTTATARPDGLVAPFLGDVWQPEKLDTTTLEQMFASGLVEERDGQLICVDPWWEVPNAIVVTQPGGGKTTLFRVLGQQLASTLPALPTGGAVLLNDGKGVGSFYLLEHLSGVKFANHLDAIVDVVHEARGEVDRRRRRLARYRREVARDPQHRPRGWWRPLPPMFLMIDDYIGWLLLLSKEQVAQVLADLAIVAFQGREVGVRLVLAMQTAHAKTLDVGLTPQIKMSCDLRIAVPGTKGMSAVQSGMLFDDRTARDRIPRVPGGGMVAVGGTQVAISVPDFPDPTDPNRILLPEETERLWNLLAA